MMLCELNQLKRQLEEKRHEMHQLGKAKGIGGQEVLEVSQELDQLLNKYDRLLRTPSSLE